MFHSANNAHLRVKWAKEEQWAEGYKEYPDQIARHRVQMEYAYGDEYSKCFGLLHNLGLDIADYNTWLRAIRTKGAVCFPAYSTSSRLEKTSSGYGGSVDGMRGFASGPYSKSTWDYSSTTLYHPVVGPRDFSCMFVKAYPYASHDFQGAAEAYAALPEGWLDKWISSLCPVTISDIPIPPLNNINCEKTYQKWCEEVNTTNILPLDDVVQNLVGRKIDISLIREAVKASELEVSEEVKKLLGFPKDPPPPLLRYHRKWYSPKVVSTSNCDVEITVYNRGFRNPQVGIYITPHNPSSPWEATVESYYGEREVFRG